MESPKEEIRTAKKILNEIDELSRKNGEVLMYACPFNDTQEVIRFTYNLAIPLLELRNEFYTYDINIDFYLVSEEEINTIFKRFIYVLECYIKNLDCLIKGFNIWIAYDENEIIKNNKRLFFKKKDVGTYLDTNKKFIIDINEIRENFYNYFFPVVEESLEEAKIIVREFEKERELKDIEDKEEARYKGQAKGLATLYEKQIELLIKYKKEGANIDKEIFEMEKELLNLENQENTAMIENLINTVRGLKQ